MTKKYIDRKTILKAIKTEPLKNKEFVERIEVNGERSVSKSQECQVCAVGAVLRHAGMSNDEIYDFGRRMTSTGRCFSILPEFIETLVKEERYLHALSSFFERTAKRLGCGKRTRDLLTKFVKDSFPEKIRIDSAF